MEIEQVIRYFIVHNLVVNGDGYTGAEGFVHNYYLHEKDGKLSMIPWDYNLAFGTFTPDDVSGAVNAPIDTTVSGADNSDRPMFAWIEESEEYKALYHTLFSAFLQETDIEAMIDGTAALIAPHVQDDPSAFCTYEEFEAGVSALKRFFALRTKSVRGQLDGTVPSTTEGQEADPSSLVDAQGLSLSDMGGMTESGWGGGWSSDSANGDGGWSGWGSAGGSSGDASGGSSSSEMDSQSGGASDEIDWSDDEARAKFWEQWAEEHGEDASSWSGWGGWSGWGSAGISGICVILLAAATVFAARFRRKG